MSSPLGLILSDINVGKHRKFNGDTTEGKVVGKKMKSLFGRSVFTPFPTTVDKSGTPTEFMTIKQVHGEDVYDTSVQALVDWSKKKRSQKLRYADFAYLKNLGVYPNNRLIVARRFPGPVGNDLNAIGSSPYATMISWFNEEDQDWFKLSYNEKYVAADVDFTNVLNEIGDSFSLQGSNNSSFLGKYLAGGLNILPFGGFSEPLQRLAFQKLGFVSDPYNLPLGNPNLIREALRRETQSKSEPGSGLACEIEISMTVEYEQKFINGVDPTIVYLDIIQNALTFGTSDAAFQMSGGFGNVAGGLINSLVGGDFSAIFNQMKNIVSNIFSLLEGFAVSIIEAIKNPAGLLGDIASLITGAAKFVGRSISAIIGKFKVRLNGIIHALTGSPSTPWHITIGNPKRPFFSSGDMLLKTVSVKFGTTLAFNDLPSTISFDLTFANARPLGANEIFNRLNTGKGRSYIRAHVQDGGTPDSEEDEFYNDTSKLTSHSFETHPENGGDISETPGANTGASTATKGASKRKKDKAAAKKAAAPASSGTVDTNPASGAPTVDGRTTTYDANKYYTALPADLNDETAHPPWLVEEDPKDESAPSGPAVQQLNPQPLPVAQQPPVQQTGGTSGPQGPAEAANNNSGSKGYQYEIVGLSSQFKSAIAKDKDGKYIGDTGQPRRRDSITDEALIQELKDKLGDN